MDIVFARSNYKYDSYEDYWRLAEASGLEICKQDDINPVRKAFYIISPMNGDFRAVLKARPRRIRTCKIIWWFLERPSSAWGKLKITDVAAELLADEVDEIWAADKTIHQSIAHLQTRFVPIGSDEKLGSPSSNKIYDIAHMSYVHGRRTQIMDYLKRFYKVAPNGWGASKDRALAASKCMVNIHQDGEPFIEPLRFAICAAHALPMISEHCGDPFPFEPSDFVSVDYTGITNAVAGVLSPSGYPKYREMGLRLRDRATKQFRFADNVKKAIAEGHK